MTTISLSKYIEPITGDVVGLEVLKNIGYFRLLKKAFISTYTLTDYDFSRNGLLTTLLSRQIIYGAEITFLTSPPPHDVNNSRNQFMNKFDILEELSRSGVNVFVHDNLHAKVFLFLDDRNVNTTIVGSANLTTGGFGVKGGSKNLLELALITSNSDLYDKTLEKVTNVFLNDRLTEDFNTWKRNNQNYIAWGRGGLRVV